MTADVLNSLVTFISFGAACFCIGCLIGVWVQKRRSHEETELLVNMWENMHALNYDVDNLGNCVDSFESCLKQQQRNYAWLHSEFLIVKQDMDGVKRDLDGLYGINDCYEDSEDDDITLELPIFEESS
jgi:hypothetical protein